MKCVNIANIILNIISRLPQGYLMCSIQMILWEVYACKKMQQLQQEYRWNHRLPSHLHHPATMQNHPNCNTRLSFDPVNIKIITYLHLISAYAETKHFLAGLGGKLKKVEKNWESNARFALRIVYQWYMYLSKTSPLSPTMLMHCSKW